jgi:malate synthase
MEDAATAEISRSQIWQWVHAGVRLAEGTVVTEDLVRTVIEEELGAIEAEVGANPFGAGRWEQARQVFEQVALADDFVDFLTLPASRFID